MAQTSMGNPAVFNPPKNTPGTNGGGLTRSDCMLDIYGSLTHSLVTYKWVVVELRSEGINVRFLAEQSTLGRVVDPWHTHPLGQKTIFCAAVIRIHLTGENPNNIHKNHIDT